MAKSQPLPNEGANNKESDHDYTKYIGKKVLFIAVCTVALVAITIAALCIGSAKLSIPEVLNQLFSKAAIAWSNLLPRDLLAVVRRSHVSCCRRVMQCILKNPQ